MTEEINNRLPGVGLDVGTAFIVAARQDKDGKIAFQQVRDVYLPLHQGEEAEFLLQATGASSIVDERGAYVIGDDAVNIANSVPGATVKRPMTSGVITKGDAEAAYLLELLLQRVLGEPTAVGETCCYTVPAEPINAKASGFFNTEYHTDRVNQILRNLGYEPRPVNEATCIAFDQLRKYRLTGVAISFGAGMCNVAHVTLGIPGLVFSLVGSGDYIDQKTADQTSITVTWAAKVKEKGFKDPQTGETRPINVLKDAASADPIVNTICLAYERMLKNVADNLAAQFRTVRIEDSIPIVVAGGTALIAGFLDLFKRCLETAKLPFRVSEVLLAPDAFYSVARGAMYRAALEEKRRVKK